MSDLEVGQLLKAHRIGAILLLWVLAASAERYQFRTFGPSDGLNTAVTQIFQDHIGFLWAATGDGLFRYDGARFQRFGTEDGLPSASMRCVRESPDGTIWVLTGRGLARWRRGTFAVRFESVPTGRGVGGDWHTMEIAANGRLFLGDDHGLLVSSGPVDQGPQVFQRQPGAPSDPAYGIHPEADGSLWFGCGLKLCLLRGGRVTVMGEAAGLPPDRWGSIMRDPHGDLWVRGAQHLYVMPGRSGRFQARDEGLPQSSNSATAMLVDREGTVWVATDLGLARLVAGRWQVVGGQQGLDSDAVTALYQDREGSMWIGIWGVGVARWAGFGEWTNWTTADGLSNNIVWAIRRHPSGALLVGTDRGLVRFDDGVPTKVWTKADGLAGDKVKAIAIDSNGIVWTASLPGGVSRIDLRTGEIHVYGQAAGLSDVRSIGLYLDAEDRLWVSAGEGLFRSNGLGQRVRFERLRPPGAQERTMFFRFFGDRQGRIWIGSSDGLFCWDHGSWTRLTTADGLKENSVSHVTETSDGAIWVAYRTPLGLSRLELGGPARSVQHITRKDGLPSEYVLFLGEDRRHRFWVGTDYGAAVRSAGKWLVYTHEEGMVWDDCAANGFLAEEDGTVWIGTLKGLSRYIQKREPQLAQPPPTVITGARFGSRMGTPDRFTEVPYGDHDFSIWFSGLSFLNEKNVRFRYRLAGLEDKWTETGMREARYSNLPPGNYRFEVAARNGVGPWTATPAVLAFRIVPPWWRNWWFIALAAGALAGGIFLLVRARTKKTERENRSLEKAVRERTEELELRKDLIGRQKAEIEELLRESQEASRLKSEFLANMSHEVRTPMNAVIGMAQLVLDTPLNDEQREYVTTMKESADALLVVINDILDFSKIEAGKLELAQEPFALRKCVADAVRVFAWKAREKGLQLTSEVAPEVPDVVVGDPDRLRQILLNLLGNATKFTERGEVAVSVCAVGASGEERSCTLTFTVRDTGIGIAEEKQAMIFEAFVQADGSSRRRQGGTGLGLAICSKLVQLMGGRIAVESAPGQGSRFYFTVALPLANAETPVARLEPSRLSYGAEAGGRASLTPEPMARFRILVAEDNRVNQMLAQRILQKLGHSVTVVEDGRQAVDRVREGSFDLVLMDVQMPVMDGFEATALIREAERMDAASGQPARHIPIVAMTAHAMSSHRQQCLHAGMDGYLSKPVVLDELVETVETLARKDKPVASVL